MVDGLALGILLEVLKVAMPSSAHLFTTFDKMLKVQFIFPKILILGR
jgi:hypothetical protein